MPKPISRRSCLALLALPLPVSLLAGCGGYSTRFQERVAKGVTSGANVRQRKVDKRLYKNPVDVADKNQKPTGIKINLPLQFFSGDSPAFKALASEPKALAKGITAAEHLVTYEIFWKDDMGKELPAYVIFASFPASVTRQQVESQLAAAWPTAGAMWTDLAEAQWRKFAALDFQGSFTNRAGQPESQGAKLNAYVQSSPQRHVVVAWHAPEIVGSAFDFFGSGEAAMYTATITDPAAPTS